MRRIVLGSNRNRRFILNMEQTPVYLSMNTKRTLELIGKKTIHICRSTDDTKRVTVAVTNAAGGTLLPLTPLFKGKLKGCITKKEFSTYPPTTHFYRCLLERNK